VTVRAYDCVHAYNHVEVECSLSYEMVGDADRTTRAGANYAGVAFLLRDEFKRDSVVFAFKGCYRNLNPARFQIWRPTQPESQSYRLITEVVHRSESEQRNLPALETVSSFVSSSFYL